ncbi:MAG: ATP-binding protein, partial [Verrucomicrobiae bacterium]|nr:ATP-binding protein [Verrucomicrobiae bacterium]
MCIRDRSSTVVYSALEDSNRKLWFATADGLLEFNQREWTLHPWPPGFDVTFRAKDGLFALKNDKLLVCASQQLLLFDPTTSKFKQITHPLGRQLRKVLRQLPDGTVCIQTSEPGASTGVYSFEFYDGNNFSEWSNSPPPIDLGTELFFLAETQHGDLWLGGANGPALWHEGKWQRFTAADGYVDEGALCFIEMPDGRIWCGGLGKISQYDGRNWNVVLTGLDRVSAMIRSFDWSVWVATGSGLYRYYKETWNSVGEEEGLPSNACYTLLEDHSRKLWVGTSGGLCQYFPRADPDAPKTTILEVVQTTQAPNENVVEIRFRGRDKWQYTPEHRLMYSCRLDGGGWSPFTPSPTAIYRDLASGKHKFEVRALDRNWNVELRPAAYEFEVLVPWYQEKRIVAVAAMGLLVALVLAAVAVNRHIRLLRSHAEVERKVAERTRELERAMAALAHSEKMTALGTLAAGIAHDFNNMLSIIRGSAQIIEANLNDPQKILVRVERIKTVVDQASGIVKAMLGFGRATNHATGTCNVSHVIENTIRLLGDRFLRERNLRVEIQPDLPQIRAGKDLLQQMLLNLILNAADAIDRDGVITVKAHRVQQPTHVNPVLAPATTHSYVLIDVEDTGVGIPPDLIQRVFEPFFTTKSFSAKRGTGLGLYMVYEFARQMGLGLAVESTLGKGSKFTIIAPVAAPETPPNNQPTPP